MRLGLALIAALLAPLAAAAQEAAPTAEAVIEAAPAAPAPAAATDNAADEARLAAEALRRAIEGMTIAPDGRDQVAALTGAVNAYEQGLAALRSGLRRAAIREGEIRAAFNDQSSRLGRLLGVMSAMEQSPETLLLLHPSGPEGTARAGMLLGSVAPAMQAEADRLKTSLAEIAAVRAQQKEAEAVLSAGLGRVQAARQALAQAIADRSDLPTRFADQPEEVTKLVAAARTLDDFAQGLSGLEQDIGAPMGDFEGAKGTLPMPVLGTILRHAGQEDAAGITRPGIIVATAPAAMVTAPWPVTIRYRGPLLDYGNVMIVEPARDYLLILAGLSVVFGQTGDVLAAGEPLGLMGGNEPAAAEFGAGFVADAREGGGAGRTETLYIELRKGKSPIDPEPWFAPTGKAEE